MTIIIGLFFALPVLASHDPNTTDADCPSTWAPQYGVTCGDPNKPKACGIAGGVPQCIATAALPTGTCNNGSVRVNCDNCTASCACAVSGNIVCSGGSPATFGTCQAPITCTIAGRVTANSCTGACGGCASGFEDLTPTTSDDACAPIRPKVTLAPPAGFPDADATADSSLYINKTGGSGNLARFQRGGTDRVIITNSGQLVLGLAADWNTFTQILGANENLIYGVIQADSSAQSNVLLFQRAMPFADIPPQTLLRLDTSGNLTVNGNVSIGGTLTVIGTINGVDMAKTLTGLTVGSAGGLTITGAGHSRAIALTNCAAGEILLSDGTAWTCNAPPQTGMTQDAADLRYLQLTGGALTGALTISDGGLTISSGGLNVTGDVSVTGRVSASGCFGAVYQQPSGTSLDGNRGGYLNANAECPGMHVCKTSEILESINCGAFAGKNTNNSNPMWIANLAPSLPTPTNDCGGWITNSGQSFGVAYIYDAIGGGAGAASCDQLLRFACCR